MRFIENPRVVRDLEEIYLSMDRVRDPKELSPAKLLKLTSEDKVLLRSGISQKYLRGGMSLDTYKKWEERLDSNYYPATFEQSNNQLCQDSTSNRIKNLIICIKKSLC